MDRFHSILGGVLCLFAASAAQFNSVKAALFLPDFSAAPNATVPSAFLARVKASGYTHVIISGFNPAFLLHPSGNGRGAMTNLYRQLDDWGLRMIPHIPVATKWAGGAWIDYTHVIPPIQMSYKGNPDSLGTLRGFPSLASFSGYDEVMDDLFQSVIDAHAEAFQAALDSGDLSYSTQDFVYLGGDEPAEDGILLAGNGATASSAFDREFIGDNMSGGLSLAYQRLFARHAHRRVQQVQQAFGTTATRVLMSGDMWDPEAHGGLNLTAWNPAIPGPDTIRLIPLGATLGMGIASLPGLNPTEANEVRQGIVLAPWNYDLLWRWGKCDPEDPAGANTCDPNGNGKYEADVTFKYLVDHGFKVMWWGTTNNGSKNGLPATLDPAIYPNDNSFHGVIAHTNMMREYASVSRKYGNSALGYITNIVSVVGPDSALVWDSQYAHPEGACYSVIEYLKKTNNPLSRARSFKKR